MAKNNYKYRRMVKRLPPEMREFMRWLRHECIVLSHHPGTMGWWVEFQIKNTRLTLKNEPGYLAVVIDPGGERKVVLPGRRRWFSSPMKVLAKKVNREFA